MWTKTRLGVALLVAALGSVASAGTILYAETNTSVPPDSGLDLGWQSAVGNSFVELDLDSAPFRVDTLTASGVTIDVGLEDAFGGTSPNATAFYGGYGAGGGTYGTVFGGALLNRDTSGVVRPTMTFSFSSPVTGFGAWIFDDGLEYGTHSITATEVGGATTTSPLIDAGNGRAFFVEGFLGVTSTVGLTRVAITVHGARFGGFMEIDHLQIADVAQPVPLPPAAWMGLAMLGLLGLGRRMRRRHE